jgi:F-box protein 39
MISPQNLGEDLVQLLGYTSLRHLHLIQNRYTPGEINIRPIPPRIWRQCRRFNPSLVVHLEVEGARDRDVLWQDCAPVYSILYDSRHIKVQKPTDLHVIICHSTYCVVFASTHFHFVCTFKHITLGSDVWKCSL